MPKENSNSKWTQLIVSSAVAIIMVIVFGGFSLYVHGQIKDTSVKVAELKGGQMVQEQQIKDQEKIVNNDVLYIKEDIEKIDKRTENIEKKLNDIEKSVQKLLFFLDKKSGKKEPKREKGAE